MSNQSAISRDPVARYHDRNGTQHEVIVRDAPGGGYQVVDRGENEVLVEQLDEIDGRAAAVAVARDYANTNAP